MVTVILFSPIEEIKRAITRSTDAQSQHASIKLINKLHKRNGYPKRFVILYYQTHTTDMQYPTHRKRTRTRPGVYKSPIYQQGPKTINSSRNQAIRYSKYQSSLHDWSPAIKYL